MRTGTVSYKLEDLKKGVIIPIGFVGENDFTRVIFDAEEVFKKHPAASMSMKVQPPKGVIYPATVTRDGNNVIWQVKEADVANRGGGELQLTFIDGETKIKTYIAKTDVKRSLAGNGPAPDPIQDFVDNANEKLAEVEQALDDLAAMDNIAKTAQASDIGKALSPKTVENGVVTEWEYITPGGGTEDYTDLDNKPSIAGVTLSGNKTLEDLGIAADDDLDNLADEVSDVKSAIQPLTPAATVSDVGKTLKVKTVSDNKVSGYEFGDIPEVPTAATSEQIKAGTDTSHPLVTVRQHEAVFFALAKLAGADMASLSPVTVGQFPDTQKTAIQKMLGIYESPWELIRNDTFTNATESDLEITVDDNGEPFELTDIVLEIKLPVQETQASIGNYGIISIYDNNNNEEKVFCGAVSQSPSDTSYKIAFVEITQSKGLFIKKYTRFNSSGNQQQLTIYANNTGIREMPYRFSTAIFSRILIKNVTGTVNIQLYGKRKWN